MINWGREAGRLVLLLEDENRQRHELHLRPSAPLRRLGQFEKQLPPAGAVDGQRLVALAELVGSLKLGYVATNHAHYPTPAEKPLGDVVAAIRHNRSLNKTRGQHYLKPAEEMAALFHRYPRALSNTLRIAEVCRYQLPSQLQALP